MIFYHVWKKKNPACNPCLVVIYYENKNFGLISFGGYISTFKLKLNIFLIS